MKYLLDQHELVANFVAQMIPHARQQGFGRNYRAIGIVDDNNELVAGLVYHGLSMQAGLIEISGAALPGVQWATRETLRLMHEYPFSQAGCQMCVMKVPADNMRLLEQLVTLGYELIFFPRLFGRNKDGMVCCLTDDAWRENKISKRLFQHDRKQHEEAA